MKIYTSGKMNGLTLEQQLEWRYKLEQEINKRTEYKPVFIHPPVFYNYEFQSHNSDREIMEWELSQVLDSNIVVVNLDRINDSVGSHFEIAHANAINSLTNKHIYIIGIGDSKGVYPWIKSCIFRNEPDIESAAEYIVNYLIN